MPWPWGAEYAVAFVPNVTTCHVTPTFKIIISVVAAKERLRLGWLPMGGWMRPNLRFEARPLLELTDPRSVRVLEEARVPSHTIAVRVSHREAVTVWAIIEDLVGNLDQPLVHSLHVFADASIFALSGDAVIHIHCRPQRQRTTSRACKPRAWHSGTRQNVPLACCGTMFGPWPPELMVGVRVGAPSGRLINSGVCIAWCSAYI